MNPPNSLSLIFDLAIRKEEAANQFYAALAQRVKNRAVQEIFTELAKEELNHKTLLTSLQAAPLIHTKFARVPDYHIAESEAQPVVTPDMPLRDAVALAMKNEQQAAQLYRVMAQATTEADVRELFENLMNMELGHKNKLETLFVDIGYPEVF